MAPDLELGGVLPVLPTPFDPAGVLMPEDIAREVEWALGHGVHGIVVLGVASEVFRLGDSERSRVIEAAVEAVSGRVPVVAGAGHLSTALATAAARAAVAAGASALLVPPPPVGRASAAAIVEYFSAIAETVEVPIILQDDPVHLGVGLAVSTIVELRERHPNCSYAKLEELPSMAKIRDVNRATAGRVSCLGGSGGVYVLEELAAGATGIMSGFSFPEGLVAVHAAWRSGDFARARELNRLLSDLARLEALPVVSLSIRKRLYVARGAMSNATLRAPAVEVDDWTWQLAERELVRVEAAWAAIHAA